MGETMTKNASSASSRAGVKGNPATGRKAVFCQTDWTITTPTIMLKVPCKGRTAGRSPLLAGSSAYMTTACVPFNWLASIVPHCWPCRAPKMIIWRRVLALPVEQVPRHIENQVMATQQRKAATMIPGRRFLALPIELILRQIENHPIAIQSLYHKFICGAP